MDIIIGAGISGISYLNFTKKDSCIIEKESEIGGYCRTIKRNGFVWDYSGHFFHFRDPNIEKIVCKNIPEETLKKVKKETSILYNGKYIDFPFQKNIHQLPKQEFIDCLYDLFTSNPDAADQSFKDMVYSNFGRSIAEKFLVPYNEKLYACDLNTLDQKAMGRFFPKASREEIVLNFKNANNSSYNEYFVYPYGGAVEYINSLTKDNDISSRISTEEEVLNIDIETRTVTTNRRTLTYNNLISTIPFPLLLQKCGIKYDKTVFTCNQVLVFNIGFNKKGVDRKNNWIYIPNKEFVFYRVGYYDNIMQGDRMSLYVEIGFPVDVELQSVDIYFERVLDDLKKCGIVTDEEVVDYEPIVMNPAYVHINKESANAVLIYKEQLAKHNIYSIGRYGSWTYCSIEDNIIEAKKLAENLSL